VKRVGIDIGGTFTDLVYWDDATGTRVIHKRPSTPQDPAQAGILGVTELCARAGVALADIDLLVHGTTVATNTLLEHTGARVGLITTRGFRDVLHIGRKSRPLNFSHAQEVPRQSRPLALRRHRIGVTERIGAPDGRVLVALDEDEARRAVRELRDGGEVEALAVCCLFAFLNPAHEQRILEIAAEEWPEVYACASHQVAPLYREYERFSTTALNAYVGPGTARYIDRFSAALDAGGCKADLGLMTSAGGIISATEASSDPVSLLLSGPVGALMAGIQAGQQVEHASVITLDVGGTSADIGVAPDGELRMKHLLDTQVGGYDAMVPMCDIGTIGAGGGSIAWIDDGGMFRVGPQSAGADPGPACYGHGGEQPTVTDAMVVLGWYRVAALEASGLHIDPDRAEAAIRNHVAEPLSLDLEEAAAGIYRVAVHNMAEAIRVNSVARGLDPREFALVAYGGAGAAFAVPVARELSIGTVIVPPAAGVGAAGGLLATDMQYHRQATLWQRLDQADLGRIRHIAEQLRGAVEQRLERDGFGPADSSVGFTADCRYQGQGYELRVKAPEGAIDAAWCAELANRFHQAHRQAYHRDFKDKPVMAINLAAVGVGHVPATEARPWAAARAGEAAGEPGEAAFPVGAGVTRAAVRYLHRDALEAGATVDGPAIIEQSDTTTVLPPGARLRVHPLGHLLIDTGGTEP
jgi:N-methylhydantoinase A/oxoprolinase/acetone carboxylase beta subunit